MKKTKMLLAVSGFAIAFFSFNCGPSETRDDGADLNTRVDSFLTDYNQKWMELTTVAGETQWKLLTHMVEGDTTASFNAQQAQRSIALHCCTELAGGNHE